MRHISFGLQLLWEIMDSLRSGLPPAVVTSTLDPYSVYCVVCEVRTYYTVYTVLYMRPVHNVQLLCIPFNSTITSSGDGFRSRHRKRRFSQRAGGGYQPIQVASWPPVLPEPTSVMQDTYRTNEVNGRIHEPWNIYQANEETHRTNEFQSIYRTNKETCRTNEV